MVCLWKPSNQSSLIFWREQLVDLTSNCSIEGKLLFRTQFCSTKDKDKDHEKMAECFSCNKAVTSHHLLTVGGKYKMQSWKRRFKQFASCPKLQLGKYLTKVLFFVLKQIISCDLLFQFCYLALWVSDMCLMQGIPDADLLLQVRVESGGLFENNNIKDGKAPKS